MRGRFLTAWICQRIEKEYPRMLLSEYELAFWAHLNAFRGEILCSVEVISYLSIVVVCFVCFRNEDFTRLNYFTGII